MSEVTMPEPVAHIHICRKRPDLSKLSYSKAEPALRARGYAPTGLITTAQAEAYKDACVRAALEEAISLSSMYGATIELDAAIRALIQPTKESEP